MNRFPIFALAMAIPLALGACSSDHVSALGEESSVNHPVGVFREPRVAFIPGDGSGHLDADANEINRFAMDYVRRGHGPIEVAGSAADIAAAARLLVRAGTRPQEIQPRAAPGPGVTLTFDAYQVSLPNCSEFASDRELFHANTNRVTSNFGCASQRNFGLMVSDPHDMIARRSSGEPSNSSAAVGGVDDHRTFTKSAGAKSQAAGSGQ